VAARELAERCGKTVAVVERRSHIAGNTYDRIDDNGVLIHEYGPHIYHTVSERVHNYLLRFSDIRDYQHRVLARIGDSYIPVPFNLGSIAMSFDADKAAHISELLLQTFGRGSKVPIIELRQADQPLLRELADYVYQNVFLHYTVKQWGLRPEEIDPAVTARVPVLVDNDDRYFQDPFQGMPADGYTALFERMLDHPGIQVFVGIDARELLRLVPSEPADDDAPIAAIEADGAAYKGLVVYTGALDELCGRRFGLLPYRSLDFKYRHYDHRPVQPCGTVNFTVSEEYTRTTEYTWLTGQDIGRSSVAEEYSRAYVDPDSQIPYYPIVSDENQEFYQRYLRLFDNLENFHVLGRLAQYRYFNMDQVILQALELVDSLSG
jgi:UDP-galactopyranose mutase